MRAGHSGQLWKGIHARSSWSWVAWLLSWALLANAAVRTGAEPSRADSASPPASDQVAARVNGMPIFVRDVELELARVLGERRGEKAALDYLRAQTLEQLIDRHLILQWLAEKGQAATHRDVEHAADQLAKKLQLREISLDDYLRQRQMNQADLRRALHWQLSWERYLQRYLTDENLERFFREHRAQFDGTRLRVAHILLSVDARGDPATRARKQTEWLALAGALRGRIQSGQLTFSEAARRHSQAPTADEGGVLGLIARHHPMPETFSAAAFRLQVGEISPPVVSPFGVHLIQCLEVLPGQQRWQDVREELAKAVTSYLFEWAAGRTKTDAEITFTGNSPHFRPGTDELAELP